MRAVIRPTSHLSGRITPPPSKSYTHRALVCAALSKDATVKNPLISRDTLATIDAIRAIGARVQLDDGRALIEGVEGEPQAPEDVIDVKNSGTTLRLMTAVCSLAPAASVLTGDSSLKKRPNQPLLDAMAELGALAFSTKGDGTAPIVVCGGKRGIKGGECTISGRVSSQFISGLLIATPLAPMDSHIVVRGELLSAPYVQLTLDVLKRARVRVDVDENVFRVPACQQYSLKSYTVPADFSSAGYLIAAACITASSLELSGLTSTLQPDARVVDIAREMGARIKVRGDGAVRVEEGCELSGIEVDCSQTPDLVPTIAAMGANATGKTLIKNVAHVRLKETDRLRAMASELAKMGIRCTEGEDFLLVEGGQPKMARVQGWDDHRIVMALAVAGLKSGVEIEGAEHVDVSYPAFFDDLARLGVDVRVEG